LLDGQVHPLDPLKWDKFAASVGPELPNRLPPKQEEILRFVEVGGGVFFGPFYSWQSET
jgi:hypothetical protein